MNKCILFHTYHTNILDTSKTQRSATTVTEKIRTKQKCQCSVHGCFRHIVRINGCTVHVANNTFVSNNIHLYETQYEYET